MRLLERNHTGESICGGIVRDSIPAIGIVCCEEDVGFGADVLGREGGKEGLEFGGVVSAGEIEEVIDVVFGENWRWHFRQCEKRLGSLRQEIIYVFDFSALCTSYENCLRREYFE